MKQTRGKRSSSTHKTLLENDLSDLDQMSGERFEEWLLAFFLHFGYKGSLTPETSDYGADLILEKQGTHRTVVQAKRWRQPVGVEAVQQIIGALKFYGASRGVVITTSVFNENACLLAQANGIELIDREQLQWMLSALQGKDQAEVPRAPINSEPASQKPLGILPDETCPWCGRMLVMRKSRHGRFVGCSGFPGCHFTQQK